jgi:hypothetical protein
MQDTLVECRSEFTYAQQPVRFLWQDIWCEVESILDQWKSPQSSCFRVMTTTKVIYELYYLEDRDIWQVQSI